MFVGIICLVFSVFIPTALWLSFRRHRKLVRQYDAVSLGSRDLTRLYVTYILVVCVCTFLIGIFSIIEHDNSSGSYGGILASVSVFLILISRDCLVAYSPKVLIFGGKACNVSDCTIAKVKTTSKGKKNVQIKCGSRECFPRMTQEDFEAFLSATGLTVPASPQN